MRKENGKSIKNNRSYRLKPINLKKKMAMKPIENRTEVSTGEENNFKKWNIIERWEIKEKCNEMKLSES